MPNKRGVRVGQGGEILQTIDFDRGCFACMLGGKEKKTLFITANKWDGPEQMTGGAKTGQVLAVQAPLPSAGWPAAR